LVFSDLRPVVLRLPFFEFYRLLRTFRLHFQSCPVFLPFPEFLFGLPGISAKKRGTSTFGFRILGQKRETSTFGFGISAKNVFLDARSGQLRI